MSAFYEVYGSFRVRNCPEAAVILDRLAAETGTGLDIYLIEAEDEEAGNWHVTIEGGTGFTAGAVLELDQLLESLGPYVVESVVLNTVYDGEAGELVIAGSEAESKETLSKHRMHQIEVLLSHVTLDGRAKLVKKLQSS